MWTYHAMNETARSWLIRTNDIPDRPYNPTVEIHSHLAGCMARIVPTDAVYLSETTCSLSVVSVLETVRQSKDRREPPQEACALGCNVASKTVLSGPSGFQTINLALDLHP